MTPLATAGEPSLLVPPGRPAVVHIGTQIFGVTKTFPSATVMPAKLAAGAVHKGVQVVGEARRWVAPVALNA
jgi:hypothetical protein